MKLVKTSVQFRDLLEMNVNLTKGIITRTPIDDDLLSLLEKKLKGTYKVTLTFREKETLLTTYKTFARNRTNEYHISVLHNLIRLLNITKDEEFFFEICY